MKKLLFTLLGLAAALTLPAQDFKITHGYSETASELRKFSHGVKTL